MFHYVEVLGREKKMLGKQTRAHRTPCYLISADAASARGRHITRITTNNNMKNQLITPLMKCGDYVKKKVQF